MSGFQKAKKSSKKLRLALGGVAGGGKTRTALEIAKGFGGKIAVIDTENSNASLYADRFDFDTMILRPHPIGSGLGITPQEGVDAIRLAEKEGYDIIIFDSTTHVWDGAKLLADAATERSKSKNSYTAWKGPTEEFARFTQAIIQSTANFIGTIRAKTEYAQEEENGRKVIKKLGLGLQVGKDQDYEYNFILMMEDGGRAVVTKAHGYDALNGRVISKPGPELGKELAAWLSDGVPENVVTLPVKPQGPALAAGQLEAARNALRTAVTLDELKSVWEATVSLFTGSDLQGLAAAKDARKAELQAVAK